MRRCNQYTLILSQYDPYFDSISSLFSSFFKIFFFLRFHPAWLCMIFNASIYEGVIIPFRLFCDKHIWELISMNVDDCLIATPHAGGFERIPPANEYLNLSAYRTCYWQPVEHCYIEYKNKLPCKSLTNILHSGVFSPFLSL